jgi:DnaK suppressor protein
VTTKKSTARPKVASNKSKAKKAPAAKAAGAAKPAAKKAAAPAKPTKSKAQASKTAAAQAPQVKSKAAPTAAPKASAKAASKAPAKAPPKAAATKSAPPKAAPKLPPARVEKTTSAARPSSAAARQVPVQKKKPAGKGLTPQQKERMKDLLLSRRKEILARTNPSDQSVELVGDAGGDSADRASTSVDKDLLAETQARDAKALQDIDGALAKIAAGSYGVCEECGCVIGQKRLEYLPNAAYCIDCQEKFEEQGMFPESMGERHDDFRLVD